MAICGVAEEGGDISCPGCDNFISTTDLGLEANVDSKSACETCGATFTLTLVEWPVMTDFEYGPDDFEYTCEQP